MFCSEAVRQTAGTNISNQPTRVQTSLATNCEAHLRKERNSIRRRYFRASWNKVLTSAATLAISLVISSLFGHEAADPMKEISDHFLSVRLYHEWVFASTPKGIYRASPHDKKWAAIPMPNRVPRARMACKARSRVVIDLLFRAQNGHGADVAHRRQDVRPLSLPSKRR